MEVDDVKWFRRTLHNRHLAMRGDIKKLKKRIKLGFCCWEPKNQGGVITGANEEGIRSGEDADFFSHEILPIWDRRVRRRKYLFF